MTRKKSPATVKATLDLLQAKGFFARAICHELDHLDGVLYIDKATHIEKA